MSTVLPLRRRKSNFVYALFSLAAVLFLSGLLAVVLLHVRGWAESLPGSAMLLVELHDNATSEESRQLLDQLRGNAAVRGETVRYISKDEAARLLAEEDGLGDFVADLGFNPLSNSVQGHLNPKVSDIGAADSLVAQLSGLPFVKEAYYDRADLEGLRGFSSKFTWALFGLALLFAAVAVSLMDNAMRLALYGDRFLVRNMQLVGATRSFIVRPYLTLGVRTGVIGGIVAVGILLVFSMLVRQALPEVTASTSWWTLLPVFVCLPLFGAVLAGLSAGLAVRKYLGRRLEELV